MPQSQALKTIIDVQHADVKLGMNALYDELANSFQDVPFNAGDFTGNGAMTFTVIPAGVGHFRWALQGSLMTISFKIGGTVGGTPNTQLRVKIPNGMLSRNAVNFIQTINSFGTGFQLGFTSVGALNNLITFQTSLPASFSNWGAGAAEVDFLESFEVVAP